MALFASFDQQIVLSLSEIIGGYPFLRSIVVATALAGVYVIPVLWIVLWFQRPKFRESLLSSILAGIVAWVGINNLVQLFYFQNRPIHELAIREWLFERPENSFPSDHVAFLAAISFFFILRKNYRAGLQLLLLTVIVGIARVGVAVHYPSDIVYGFITGAVAAFGVTLIHPWLCRSVWPRVITVAKWLKLG